MTLMFQKDDLNEVSNTLNKAVNKCACYIFNILVIGDFSTSKMDTNNYLSDFIDTFV